MNANTNTATCEQETPDVQSQPIIRVVDLAVSFDNGKGPRIQAVDGVRMSVYPGQTLAVVGESGCGKSVTAMSTLKLIPRPPGRFDRGSIEFAHKDGTVSNLLDLDEPAMRDIRGNDIAMIFQEPMTSLNPVYSIGDQITEAIELHQNVGRKEAKRIATTAMADVGIPDPASRLKAYPHQFSGGMRQRVMIAMALACKPRLLLADEPSTALDVTIQAQILELLATIKESHTMAVMLITHDLGVVAQNADIVCVMYAGRVVEYARVDHLFANPLHPYTRGLLECIPKIGSRTDRLVTIQNTIERKGEFEKLTIEGGEPVVPWWPWHDPPAGVVAHDEATHDETGDYVLAETRPGHWVGLWRTEAFASHEETFPDLRWTKPAATPKASNAPSGDAS
jgi:peptide/nickel transport system ATP-binding protein